MYTRLSALLLLAACATDPASLPADQLAPPLILEMGQPTPGEGLVLTATGANPGDVVYFGLGGLGAGPCISPGVCLDIVSPTLLGRTVADASGTAVFEGVVPANAPVGVLRGFQAGVAGANGYASNLVERTIQDRIDALGVWIDAAGTTVEVDNQVFSDLTILSYDNDAGTIIARDAATVYRVDFQAIGDQLFTCTSGHSSEAAAEAAPSAGDDLSTGCGGPWQAWDANGLDIAGQYLDAFGTDHDITEAMWIQSSSFFSSDWMVSRFSNADQYVIAQNSPFDAFNPNLWSRFDWAFDAAGDVYYCQIAFSAATEWDALQTTSADPTNLASGCSGFSWTSLTP
jgi:hypothetical protein